MSSATRRKLTASAESARLPAKTCFISKSANSTYCCGKDRKPWEGPKNRGFLRKQIWGYGWLAQRGGSLRGDRRKGAGLWVKAGEAKGFGWVWGSLGLVGDFGMARARLNIAGFFTLLNRIVSGGGVSENGPEGVNI